ncbi:hypothetical protein Q9L58_010589 [Maublancomyces gigas]|uniref:eCIS core domain-containing protein n=1 Tax=Discina gigas TaxID=1032678 RepID=A0ABR3G425_9PEZI
MSMDHLKVHYNSDKPAQLQAQAYAQGNEIHLGPGQERHLPHEAWHVVQQAQGRVRPTLQMKAGAVNDDPLLESEADRMGEKAAQFKGGQVVRNVASEESTEDDLTQRVAGFETNTSLSASVAEQTMGIDVPEEGARHAVVLEKPGIQQSGGPNAIIQAKIGMEFECANGESWKVKGRKAMEDGFALIKDTKQAIYENGNSFEVQGDQGHLEFVTKPHSDWISLSSAVTGITNLVDSWKGKNFNAQAGSGNWKGPANYVDYNLNCKGEPIFKPQASLGLSLSQIPKFFAEASSRQSRFTESLKPALEFVLENDAFGIVASANEKYKKYFGIFYKELDRETHARLTGFVSLISAVIYSAYTNSGKNLKDAKYAFEMMPRTDFKAMALGLGLAGWGALNVWIKEGYLQEALTKTKITMGEPLFTHGYLDANGKFLKGPTRGEWLQSILSWPDNTLAKDMLSPPLGYPRHDDPSHQPPEGIGTMGMDGEMAVFELRDVLNGANKTLNVTEMQELARAIAALVSTANEDRSLKPPKAVSVVDECSIPAVARLQQCDLAQQRVAPSAQRQVPADSGTLNPGLSRSGMGRYRSVAALLVCQPGNLRSLVDRLDSAKSSHPKVPKLLSDVECRALAEQYLLRLAQQWGEELVLLPSPFETRATFAYGYNTADFLTTGNYIYALEGNGPLMVS